MRNKNAVEGYKNFLDHIMNGDLPVGEVITQKEICGILKTSISPLRETLVLLEELELIEVKARAGIKIVRPDVAFVRENMEFRLIMETAAMPALIDVVSDAWIDQTTKDHLAMKTLVEDGKGAHVLEVDLRSMDNQFHRDIVASLDNSNILKAHERSQSKLQLARRVYKRRRGRQVNIDGLVEHLDVLECIKNRDADRANQMLKKHLSISTHRIVDGS